MTHADPIPADVKAVLLEARSGLCAYTGGVTGACSETIKRIDSLLADRARNAALVSEAVAPVRFRHKKRGTEYTVVGEAELHLSSQVVDGSDMIVYRGVKDGRLWVREAGEFHDGRFERVPASHPDLSEANAEDREHG